MLVEALLIGDGDRHLFLRLDQLLIHVDDDLVQHLLRVFGLVDQIVDVALEQLRETAEESHFRVLYAATRNLVSFS